MSDVETTERPGTEEDPAAGPAPADTLPDGRAARIRSSFRYAGTPVIVLLSYGLLYLYVRATELDSIEERILSARNLRAAAIEHLEISLWSTVIVLATAIPVGIMLTRPWARRLTPVFVGAANIGQGIPAIGTFVLAFLILFRHGRNAAVTGLVIYCFLPVLRATLVGLQQVDRSVIKAARGMGLSTRQILGRIELPLSVPVLLTGVRTALVLNVSTAVLAGFIGGGTFGRIIIAGFSQSRALVVTTGAVLAAGFALLADWLGSLAEDRLRPRGL